MSWWFHFILTILLRAKAANIINTHVQDKWRQVRIGLEVQVVKRQFIAIWFGNNVVLHVTWIRYVEYQIFCFEGICFLIAFFMITTLINILASVFIRHCILSGPVKSKSYRCFIKNLKNKGNSCRRWICFCLCALTVRYWSSFLTSVTFFPFSRTLSKQKQRLQKWWFYALWTLLLKASFCCDANRNLKLANGLMGWMSSEVITLPDGQKL